MENVNGWFPTTALEITSAGQNTQHTSAHPKIQTLQDLKLKVCFQLLLSELKKFGIHWKVCLSIWLIATIWTGCFIFVFINIIIREIVRHFLETIRDKKFLYAYFDNEIALFTAVKVKNYSYIHLSF